MTALIPFNWWWSGRYWYCKVHPKARSGCGKTKPQAAHDARKEFERYQRRHVCLSGQGTER